MISTFVASAVDLLHGGNSSGERSELVAELPSIVITEGYKS
jgi:hypothetical protein